MSQDQIVACPKSEQRHCDMLKSTSNVNVIYKLFSVCVLMRLHLAEHVLNKMHETVAALESIIVIGVLLWGDVWS